MAPERGILFEILLEMALGDELDTTISRILDPLGSAIADVGARLEKADSTNSPDVDWWVDEEVGIIEELLGVAFVACQVQITSIVSGIERLHRHAEKQSKRLAMTDRTRADVMGYGFAVTPASPYPPVQVIYAFANYYKHRDQWGPGEWDRPTGLSAMTIQIIRSAGAEHGSTGNLRQGAEYLGNPQYQHLSVFSGHLSGWRKDLARAYEAELKEKGLMRAAKSERGPKPSAQRKPRGKRKR